jgi:hypothetical protein
MNEEIVELRSKTIFFTDRLDRQKIIHLILYVLITAFQLVLPLMSKTEDYHSFDFYDILKAIVFLVWLLYAAFLMDLYDVMRYSRVIIYFILSVVFISLIFYVAQVNLLILPILLFSIYILVSIFLQKLDKRKELSDYRDAFLEYKLTNITIVGFVIFAIVLQFIWAFKSPDSISIFLSARNIVENSSIEIYEPLIEYSPGFIRKLFIFSSDTTMRSQYPIGAIYLFAVLMKYAVYWRIIFVIISIVFAQEVIYFYKNLKDDYPHPVLVFLVLFLSQVLIQITTGIGVDYFTTTIGLIGINAFIELTKKEGTYRLVHLIVVTLVMPLLKVSVFVFYLFMLLMFFVYILRTDFDARETVKLFIKKHKIAVIVASIVIFLGAIGIFIFSLLGYLEQFSIIGKLTRVFYAPNVVFYNLAVNILQMFLIYIPIFIEYLIPKKWRRDEEQVTTKKTRRFILYPFIAFAIVFVFFWNSSNLYPFDIGCRYFLPFAIIIGIFSNIKDYKKELKFTLVAYVLLTNSIFLFHAMSLDHANNKFAFEVNAAVEDDAILVTDYYSKLFPDNTVYIPGLLYAGNETEVYNDISFLLNNSYKVYFIPDSEDSFNDVFYNNFSLSLVYKWEAKGIYVFFPIIGGYDSMNPFPRELYNVTKL